MEIPCFKWRYRVSNGDTAFQMEIPCFKWRYRVSNGNTVFQMEIPRFKWRYRVSNGNTVFQMEISCFSCEVKTDFLLHITKKNFMPTVLVSNYVVVDNLLLQVIKK